MITQLATYHDLRAIPVIQNFVLETGRYFGAGETETSQLELAAEEAASFIINSFKPDAEKPFIIECEPEESGLIFRFRNRGIPVDEENLPAYDTRSPGTSLDGLQLFLLESMTDFLSLENEAENGWVLLFRKRLLHMRRQDAGAEITTDTELKQCAKEKLVVGLAEPSDAYAIVKLTYLTYHYSYAKSVFYHREILQQAIADKSIMVFVAKNGAGEVVVSSAYLRSTECREIVEAGMLMSSPKYRRNRALIRVSRMQSNFLKECQTGLLVTYANLVTTHTQSQKLVKLYGFIPTALKLSVHDPVEFVEMQSGKKQRESLLYAVFAPNGFEKTTIFLPLCHHGITRELTEDCKTLELSDETEIPQNVSSQITVLKKEREQMAEIVLESAGQDWLTELRAHVTKLHADGYVTIHLHLPAHQPQPELLEDALGKLDFFYAGIIIKTLDRWNLLYVSLHAQHFDFDALALSDPRSVKLLTYIQNLYKKLDTLL